MTEVTETETHRSDDDGLGGEHFLHLGDAVSLGARLAPRVPHANGLVGRTRHVLKQRKICQGKNSTQNMQRTLT